MRLGDLLKTWRIQGGVVIAEFFGGLILNGPLTVTGGINTSGPATGPLPVALVQAATVAIDASLGNDFVLPLTTNVAFILGNPTNPPAASSQLIRITVKNTSGGAHGAGTFDTLYKVSATPMAAIANTKNRTLQFRWDGTNWVEMVLTAADVAN
jgi:hypothetical protein